MKYISIWMVGCMLLSLGAKAQQVVKLDLQRTIEIANDSSLSAFRYQNLYLSGYWEYRTYKANRLRSQIQRKTRQTVRLVSTIFPISYLQGEPFAESYAGSDSG